MFLLPVACTIGIVVLQPDMGNTFVIFSSVFVIYWVAGLNVLKIFLFGSFLSPIIIFYNNEKSLYVK
ncbi:MAG: hypothetical protein KatS3mg068_2544 [Candidatus Sericytochromatia bacterium]|nr:MAG: hypothetical protein KatS3mg068_2544 [Candidatus Sericytochromatia bacterium]